MMRHELFAAAALMLLAAACSPKSETKDTAPAPASPSGTATDTTTPAATNPFLGTWTVSNAATAPWYDGANGPAPIADPDFMGKTIVFAQGSASGSPIVACDRVIYTISTVGPDMLFEGGLKDPAKDAAALGFKSDQIQTMNEGCDVATGDMELDFPMVDNDTLLVGLNNMIYTLTRQK